MKLKSIYIHNNLLYNLIYSVHITKLSKFFDEMINFMKGYKIIFYLLVCI